MRRMCSPRHLPVMQAVPLPMLQRAGLKGSSRLWQTLKTAVAPETLKTAAAREPAEHPDNRPGGQLRRRRRAAPLPLPWHQRLRRPDGSRRRPRPCTLQRRTLRGPPTIPQVSLPLRWRRNRHLLMRGPRSPHPPRPSPPPPLRLPARPRQQTSASLRRVRLWAVQRTPCSHGVARRDQRKVLRLRPRPQLPPSPPAALGLLERLRRAARLRHRHRSPLPRLHLPPAGRRSLPRRVSPYSLLLSAHRCPG